MKSKEKLLITVLVLGILGAIGGYGVFAAFSATTSNTGNQISAGTVDIEDNDAGATLYSVDNAKPGPAVEKCIKVTYTGSLDSDVKLYTPSTLSSLAPMLDLEIMPGTQASATFPNCTGFVPGSAAVYTGTLAAFAGQHSSYATGLLHFPAGQTRWATNDAVVYRVRIAVQDTDAAQGLSTGLHELTWEARNQ